MYYIYYISIILLFSLKTTIISLKIEKRNMFALVTELQVMSCWANYAGFLIDF